MRGWKYGLAVLSVGALVATACGGDDDEDTAAPSTTAGGEEGSTTTAAAPPDNPFEADVWTEDGFPDYANFDMSGLEIKWADFGGAVHDDFRAAYLDEFSSLTGVEITDGSPFDYAQVRAQVESGNYQYDIITGAPTSIDQECGVLYEELPDDLFNWDGVRDEYESSRCSVPHGTTALLLTYNTNTYGDNPPTTCADFFDTEAFPGVRGMWTSVLGYPLEVALLADGVEPEDIYPIDYDRAFAKLDEIRDDLSLFENLTVGQEGQANEEYDMLMMTSVRGYRNALAGTPYKPVWGCSVGQVTALGILKGTPRLRQTIALAGYATTAEAQTRAASIRAQTPVTEGLELEDVDPVMQDYISFFHEDEMPIPVVDTDWWAENFDDAEQRFQQWQVG